MDPSFAKELKPRDYFEKILKYEKSFREVKGAESKASDKKWKAKNQYPLSMIVQIARILRKTHAGTSAWAEAKILLDRYGIELGK